MPARVPLPTDADLSRSCREIATAHGVSMSTAHRWKAREGLTSKRERSGLQPASIESWGLISKADWMKGYGHVGKLMGATRQAAHQMRDRMLQAGYEIPKRKPGRPKGAEDKLPD